MHRIEVDVITGEQQTIELTPAEKLAAAGLSVDELKVLLGLE